MTTTKIKLTKVQQADLLAATEHAEGLYSPARLNERTERTLVYAGLLSWGPAILDAQERASKRQRAIEDMRLAIAHLENLGTGERWHVVEPDYGQAERHVRGAMFLAQELTRKRLYITHDGMVAAKLGYYPESE